MRYVILYLPGFLVGSIGKSMSQTSRVYTNSLRDPQRIVRTIHTHAQKAFRERSFQVIISGHVHLRDETTFAMDGQKMTSYNLGSWDDHCRALLKRGSQWKWEELL